MGVTFALVHGAWSGGWWWDRLLEPLEERGHRAVAMDLPAEEPGAGLDAYADTIAAAVEDAPGEVVVVGHSLGGLPISLVAARRPVRSIVYLAAFIPSPGESMVDQFGSSPEPILLFEAGGRETDEAGRSRWTDPAAATKALFPDLSEEDADSAFARMRAQAQTTQVEEHPTGLPSVPVTSIVCSEDRVLNPEWFRRVSRERLGVEPVELTAGHFAMVTDPDLLADALVAAAQG